MKENHRKFTEKETWLSDRQGKWLFSPVVRNVQPKNLEIIFYNSDWQKTRSLTQLSITKPVGGQRGPDPANGEQFGNIQ